MTTSSNDTRSTPAATEPAVRPRYLRIGIALRPRSATVVSVAVAHGVPAQPLAAGHSLLAVVDVEGSPRHVARFQDPFTRRSTRTSKGGDHHFAEDEEGFVVVSVPFGTLTDLTRTQIRLVDLGDSVGPVSSDALVAELDRLTAGGRLVHRISYDELVQNPDFARVAVGLGIPVVQAVFEVYVDKAGKYRWRLRTTAGSIVAASGQGFAARAECEADLQWLRRSAATAPIHALDITRSSD